MADLSAVITAPNQVQLNKVSYNFKVDLFALQWTTESVRKKVEKSGRRGKPSALQPFSHRD